MDNTSFLTSADLRSLRSAVCPTALWKALGLEQDKRLSKAVDWWARSPLAEEKTASFHMDMNSGKWYCFSTQTGGGPIELVRKIEASKGRILNSYEAGRWLLEAGISSLPNRCFSAISPLQCQETKTSKEPTPPSVENTPIRQNLVPLLEYHPLFAERGISPSTCEYLGAGFFPLTNRNKHSPMQNRLVFQVRGIKKRADPAISTCLTHIGRATNEEQPEKWRFYGTFHKTLELYNIDHLYDDSKTQQQIQATKTLIIVEGCFDVAKLVEAGIRNVVAIFGAHISEAQQIAVQQIIEHFSIQQCWLWFDRDTAGRTGMQTALAGLQNQQINARIFPWEQTFQGRGQQKGIPTNIQDVCDFTPSQLRWLIRKLVCSDYPFFSPSQ